MLSFNMKLYQSIYLLTFIAVCFFTASFFLPIEYSFENHFLENFEVVVLIVGMCLSVYKFKEKNRQITGVTKPFYAGCGILFFIMILRELSWGRVFYPIGVKPNGEELYMSVHNIWYGEFIYPIVALLAIGAVFCLIKSYMYCKRHEIVWDVPIIHFIYFVVMMVISQCVFEKEIIGFLNPYNQLLEESAELTAYFALVFFIYDWAFVNFKGKMKKGFCC